MMVELSMVRDFVAIFGVIAGFSYYVLTVRANQKNQELALKAQEQQLDTRQFQLLMQMSQFVMNFEGQKAYIDWLNMEWTDYDDFEKKYGSDNNPENYALRTVMGGWMSTMGLLLKNKMIAPELIYEYVGNVVIWTWSKYKDIILKQRELYSNPESNKNWEYLYYEMRLIHEARGYSAEYSKTPTKYTSEIKEKAITSKTN